MQVPPTDIVYNEGLWMLGAAWPLERMEAFLGRMRDDFASYHQARNKTFIAWKTTTLVRSQVDFPDTPVSKSDAWHQREIAMAHNAGINVTDAHAISQAIHSATLTDYAYEDGAHVRPFVSEQMNDLLLNQLCGGAGVQQETEHIVQS